jgi:putative PEP-CTERM system histidine kinase
MDSSIEASQIGAVFYGLAAALFLFLTVLLAVSWERKLQGGLLILASITTAAWAGIHGYAAARTFGGLQPYVLPLADALRDAAWYAFLLRALGLPTGAAVGRQGLVRVVALGAVVLVLAVGSLGLWSASGPLGDAESARGQGLLLTGNLLLAVVGLLLVEQLYRNATPEHRWGLKFLCIGIGGMFAYDFYMYADGLLFHRVHPALEYARGGVAALAVPLIAISANRLPHWSVQVFISRHVVFHSATLVGAGIYLLVMAAAGYYIRAFGGDWGPALQALFLFGAVVVLAVLLFSGKLRAELKVFINKHFYKNKYDYREEWLRFTELFSQPHEPGQLRLAVLRGLASIVGSDRGTLWLRSAEEDYYELVEIWNVARPAMGRESADSPLVHFLRERTWVVNLSELESRPELYDNLEQPAWLAEHAWPWLVVPMLQQEQLVGFVVLGRPGTNIGFNWEDSDLLKMVGRQAASYFAWFDANEALAQARQFEAFNRLSAFVVHDLKNLAGQLSLVVSNARRHMGKPEFVADAVETVGNAVSKMNRLLAQLRQTRQQMKEARVVALSGIVESVIRERATARPIPAFVMSDEGLEALADPDRLSSVLQHLVQNAQEATPDDGEVEMRLRRDGDWTVIEIEDTGCGMDEEFIRERLFRPFDTTKGNAGMGVGVYESREFARALGGDLLVASKRGVGTTFTLQLPVYRTTAEAAVSTEQPLRAAH